MAEFSDTEMSVNRNHQDEDAKPCWCCQRYLCGKGQVVGAYTLCALYDSKTKRKWATVTLCRETFFGFGRRRKR